RSTNRVRAGRVARLGIMDGIRVSRQWRDRKARRCAAEGKSVLVVVEDLDDGGLGAATNRVDAAQGRALHEARGRISTIVVAAARGRYRDARGARRGPRRHAAGRSDTTAGGRAVRPVAAQVRPWRGLGRAHQAGLAASSRIAEATFAPDDARGGRTRGWAPIVSRLSAVKAAHENDDAGDEIAH